MKYIKLFESWLNEAEVERKFSSASPKSTPVLETTIENLYDGGLDGAGTKTLLSIIRRSNQTSDSEFKKSAGQDIDLKGVEDSNPYHRFGDEAIKSSQILKFLKQYITPFSESPRWRLGWNGRNNFHMFLVSVGGSEKGFLIVPSDLKYYQGDKNQNCSNLPILYRNLEGDSNWYTGFLGQVMLHAQRKFAKAIASSVYSEEKNYDAPIAEIFAGEGKARNLAYNATIAGTKFLAVATPDEEPKNIESSPLDSTLIVDKDKTIYIGQIRFDFDKATLKEESKEVLGGKDLRIALSDATKSIEIVGHTDGKGDASYNQKLSENRAKSVLEYLKTLSWYKKLEVQPTIKGVGSSEQIKDDNKGTDPIFSSINRRVEFLIDGAKANYSEIISATEKMKS